MLRNKSGFARLTSTSVFWISLVFIAYFTTAEHMQLSAKFLNFNDDARQQIWPLLRYKDAELFPNDYVANYYLTAFLPLGYSVSYEIVAPFIDPRWVSKVLPYLLLLITVVSIGLASWRLGGPTAAWLSATIMLTADIYLMRMTGGLPRSFGFPLIALLLLGTVLGRPYLLGAVTIAGAMFYYVVSAIGGMLLFAYLFAIPSSWRGLSEFWSLQHRLLILVATGITCGLIVLPGFLATKTYGPYLSREYVANFPEAGVGGRYAPRDLPVTENVATESIEAGGLTFGGKKVICWATYKAGKAGRKLIVASILSILIVGFAILWKRDVAARRVILLAFVAVAGYYAAEFFAPYLFLPYRYLLYTLPLLMAAVFPVTLLCVVKKISKVRDLPGIEAFTAFAVLGLILLLGGGPGESRGLKRTQEHTMYEVISQLPINAVVAGWPTGIIQNVPYLTERSAFLTYETHQAFHREYALEMRSRMEALISAYVSLEFDALKALNRKFGVTHLLLNREHFVGNFPTYFKPFDEAIDVARSKESEKTWSVKLAKLQHAVEYKDDEIMLINLKRIW